MRANIYVGRDQEKNNVFINFNKEDIHTIVLTGASGSGKSIFHFSLYHQLIQQNTSEELGFVFLDMTRIDFGNFPYSAYLHKPVIVDIKEALECLEELGRESRLRSQGKADSQKSILIHIEECDMVYHDQKRFEQAWLNSASYKDKNNMYVVFSSSRCCSDVFTKTILDNTDLKILFSSGGSGFNKSLYDEYSVCLFDKRFESAPSEWQRVLVTGKSEILCQGYLKEEVTKIKNIF